ncbi:MULTISPECIES: hypothetical protein [Paenibacillus]|uniref:DUF4025 domain-containing protein n=1 Tax=Paenibacillus curdlanolyticus YK9 TaxID=717606 RepID=E0I775_9BACL|nr:MULTISPECIES: hypothetical protein [Paenibacillus]EFM11891.1 hypothetical protein PaecuDRAFT_1499 [Paenibacillus curdlanolyticus YK9]MWC30397.1 hypothetical protein [Paenibacillus sp. MMS18-CY102]
MANENVTNTGEAGGPDAQTDSRHDGRDSYEMDIDRMVNEGLGGGQVTVHNGLIDASTTDYMDNYLAQLNDEEAKEG